MFLSIQKHTLPVIYAEKDGVTFNWPTIGEPLISNIKTLITETIQIHVHIFNPISIPFGTVSLECLVDDCPHSYQFDAVYFFARVVCSAKYGGLQQNVTIESISIRLKSKDVIPLWVEQEKHRIVATLKRDQRLERITLGRAQRIITRGVRTYTWLSFKDIDPDAKINEDPPPFNISPRLEAGVSTEVDHDNFSNMNAVLPITLLPECIATIQFFNLKDKPPRFLEWSIRWATLVEQATPPPSPFMRRLSLLKPKSSPRDYISSKIYIFKEELTKHVEAHIIYRFTDPNIVVEEIKLVVSRYREALDAMNDAVGPKTI